jgi:hypothetical protein
VNKKDYAKLKYPIHLLKKGESVFDLSDIKPLRKQFEEQTGLEQEIGLDPEFVMKYIILMNAYGSPAIEKYPHLGKRKTWVLSELGVHPNANNKYEDKYNYLTLNKIPEILMKIQLFRSIQKPVDFAIMLHAEEELFWLNQPIDPDNIGDTLDEIKNKRALIEVTRKQYALAKERFMDYSTSAAEELAVDTFIAQTRLGIRHEETIRIMPPPVEPKHAKADTFFNEVGN